MQTYFKFLVFLLAACAVKPQNWYYNDQEAWKQDFPTCSGMKQSPIAINTAETQMKSYDPIVFTNYENYQDVMLVNLGGKTAEVEYPEESVKPQISGGPLASGATYELANVHFHWGANDSVGSEHVINGQRYSVEVHVVHYNLKYGTLQEATQHADGVAVIAAFYQGNPSQGLAGFQGVSDALPNIMTVDAHTDINNFRLSALLGGVNTRDKRTYFTYQGSLTTPPCSEAVTWIIYPNPLAVKSSQIQPLRTLNDPNGNPLVNNFRSLQARNGRKIYLGLNKIAIPLLSKKK